ncbi:MAG: hypothetical protein LH475_01080 [Cryobacterium sp.]|uniref:hypothetical protein n=1 Tax=unclassified Cryobacterium TaxID=2649013 RepID=UPI0018C8DC04|nr:MULTISPECIES: hypothetical protein [unclassified Cryobacterium]MCY7403223.1 hypothetical protein [Cryobacterium sp.]MEC5154530.1 hypothetical protein [Cryobacterium sp. CAN_C3]
MTTPDPRETATNDTSNVADQAADAANATAATEKLAFPFEGTPAKGTPDIVTPSPAYPLPAQPDDGLRGAQPAASAARLHPRFSTILWGVLLLAFATCVVVFSLVPIRPDPTLWLLGGVIAVGLGLVVAGIAAAARRSD